MSDKTPDNYNMVLVKNPMNEDFIFGHDNKGKTLIGPDGKSQIPNPEYNEKGNYSIKAGETRPFPKFIAEGAIKTLVDEILMKKDPEGKLITNKGERDAITKVVFVSEEKYERPVVPTSQQIVDQMGSDLERAMQEKKNSTKTPTAKPEDDETFDGLEENKQLSREDMLAYAKGTLSIDLETVLKANGPNKGKTIGEVYESLTDEELRAELQMGE